MAVSSAEETVRTEDEPSAAAVTLAAEPFITRLPEEICTFPPDPGSRLTFLPLAVAISVRSSSSLGCTLLAESAPVRLRPDRTCTSFPPDGERIMASPAVSVRALPASSIGECRNSAVLTAAVSKPPPGIGTSPNTDSTASAPNTISSTSLSSSSSTIAHSTSPQPRGALSAAKLPPKRDLERFACTGLPSTPPFAYASGAPNSGRASGACDGPLAPPPPATLVGVTRIVEGPPRKPRAPPPPPSSYWPLSVYELAAPVR
mmetsp:Transcript_32104/g.80020  ORF Transcript_32104/g.80020 Transcript_32104/m.80020 type:complete len:260 (+) Transcript_32104:6022-6801(+)